MHCLSREAMHDLDPECMLLTAAVSDRTWQLCRRMIIRRTPLVHVDQRQKVQAWATTITSKVTCKPVQKEARVSNVEGRIETGARVPPHLNSTGSKCCLGTCFCVCFHTSAPLI